MTKIILVSTKNCRPCQQLKQMMASKGHVFTEMDGADAPIEWGICGFPTLVKLKEGRVYTTLAGMQTASKIAGFMSG